MKIIAELREKYSAEFHTGSRWKKLLLEFRVYREAESIYRYRLNSTRRSLVP